jgi:hypothetical protein
VIPKKKAGFEDLLSKEDGKKRKRIPASDLLLFIHMVQ